MKEVRAYEWEGVLYKSKQEVRFEQVRRSLEKYFTPHRMSMGGLYSREIVRRLCTNWDEIKKIMESK